MAATGPLPYHSRSLVRVSPIRVSPIPCLMQIHVLLAVDANQVIGCAVSMRSIIDNAGPDAQLHFHVLTNGVPERDRSALRATVEGSGRDAQITLRDVDLSPFEHLMRSKTISHTAYARLLLDTVMPGDVERCLYVDCDMVVECDIRDAWRFPLEGHTVAAVSNGSLEDTQRNQERLGLAEARYFNSGFTITDVKRWRALNVAARALACAEAVGDRLILHDQDAMNCALQGDWVELPKEWNASVPGDDWLTTKSRAVFHYRGAPKPWQVDYAGRFHGLFLRYLERTAYAGHRPWNPLGLGALFARARRRIPYLPAALRVARGALGLSRGARGP